MSTLEKTTGSPFYKKFDVEELGINKEEFLSHMQPAFETLEWDMYDVERGGLKRPNRKRGIAKCILEKRNGIWEILRTPAEPYVQQMNHENFDRTTPRVYPEIDASVMEHPSMHILMQEMAKLVESDRSDVTKMSIIIILNRIVADQAQKARCTIEDIHQDGVDYVVPAVVCKRENIGNSGKSSVHDLQKNTLMEWVLEPGEGTIQNDQELCHNITPIEQEVLDVTGIRDILGFDIQILSPSSL